VKSPKHAILVKQQLILIKIKPREDKNSALPFSLVLKFDSL